MKLKINNQPVLLDEGSTLTQAISQFGASGQFAVALNGQFVSKQHYPITTLNGDDKVEILAPLEGG
ncbi:MAG: sulfur carrier protein [Alteromonadaceae bacterium]|jgi:sulfur carrier protein